MKRMIAILSLLSLLSVFGANAMAASPRGVLISQGLKFGQELKAGNVEAICKATGGMSTYITNGKTITSVEKGSAQQCMGQLIGKSGTYSSLAQLKKSGAFLYSLMTNSKATASAKETDGFYNVEWKYSGDSVEINFVPYHGSWLAEGFGFVTPTGFSASTL